MITFRFIFAIAFLLSLSVINAQDEQENPECTHDQCRSYLYPFPETGFWFDREEAGTGFVFEVQNGSLSGYWFGYDKSGQPAWFLISGALDPRAEAKRGWMLEAELQRFEGGNCIGCEFIPPDEPEDAGTIELEFLSRTEGRFRVNGGSWNDLSSFTYGVETREPFTATDDLVSDFDGLWTIVYQNRKLELRHGQKAAIGSVAVEMTPLFVPEEDLVGGGFYQYEGGVEPVPVGTIECRPGSNSQFGVCKIDVDHGAGLRVGNSNAADTRFFMPIANLSDSYFYAKSPEGDTLEGFRTSYD